MRSAEFFSGYCKGQRYAAEMTNLKAQPQTLRSSKTNSSLLTENELCEFSRKAANS